MQGSEGIWKPIVDRIRRTIVDQTVEVILPHKTGIVGAEHETSTVPPEHDPDPSLRQESMVEQLHLRQRVQKKWALPVRVAGMDEVLTHVGFDASLSRIHRSPLFVNCKYRSDLTVDQNYDEATTMDLKPMFPRPGLTWLPSPPLAVVVVDVAARRRCHAVAADGICSDHLDVKIPFTKSSLVFGYEISTLVTMVVFAQLTHLRESM
ncbi:hypothetical protein F511_10978 [Dorcoceras hygrometricum]|uniref:Uncharacterized protein n=1 Tax=Dorcoceras hygrometricum TaxID=472368 RepID=A0A2Z7B1E6_9LAMI|nr:hypothetical protein F511_10978 [Dorcoceras hygrometricum]